MIAGEPRRRRRRRCRGTGRRGSRPAGRPVRPVAARAPASSAAISVLEPGLDLVRLAATARRTAAASRPSDRALARVGEEVRRRPGAGRPAPRPAAAQCSTVIRRGQRPSRQLTIAAGLSRKPAQRPAVARMHRQRTRQPVSGQMLHQAEEERQVGRGRPASRRWSGCSGPRSVSRRKFEFSTPSAMPSHATRAPPARSRRGRPQRSAAGDLGIDRHRLRRPGEQRDRRRAEGHRLLGDADLLDRHRAPLAAGVDQLLDQELGRGGAGRERRASRTPSSQAQSTSAARRGSARPGRRRTGAPPRPAARELDELAAPTTRNRSTRGAIAATAVCRLVVA